MTTLPYFHDAVSAWFGRTFPAPTPAQAEAWPAIQSGQDVLIAAPTGSGKTLAAFLAAIDELVREGEQWGLPDETRVLYVSPLKALSNDINRNLEAPLNGIREELRNSTIRDVEIRTWVRTGDTPQYERAQMRRKPPHIVVTTPESLYILLGSPSGREMLATTRTVIVDEIHAVAGSKRGAHLAVSLERLDALAGRRVTRIGLSATQKPIDEVARFLVGVRGLDAEGNARCRIVDSGHTRQRDLALELPDGAARSGDVERSLDADLRPAAQLIREHRTTLVFVNTRRHAERVARHLSERLDTESVAAHHGSLAQRAAPRCRAAPEARRAEGAGRDCVAGARHRHRRRRPRVPAQPRRARSMRSCSGSAARATRWAARRRAGCSRCRATISWSARRCSTACGGASSISLKVPQQSTGRAVAADRRRSGGARLQRERAVRAVSQRVSRIARSRARRSTRSCTCWRKASRTRRGRHGALLHHDARESHDSRAQRRAAHGDHFRRRDSGHGRLPGACSSPRATWSAP